MFRIFNFLGLINFYDWLITPSKPTETMIREAIYTIDRKYDKNVSETLVKEIYQSMLHARPKKRFFHEELMWKWWTITAPIDRLKFRLKRLFS